MYTTQADIQGYLKRELTEEEATIIHTVIQAVKQYIDIQTSTIWASDDNEASTRLYDGGDEYLFIDAAQEVTQVEWLNADGDVNNVYETGDWQAEPLNGPPYTRIRLRRYYRWPRGYGAIRVTARWGEGASVPADIKHVATVLVGDWLESDAKNLTSESIEGYSRSFAAYITDKNSEVDKILEARKRVRL